MQTNFEMNYCLKTKKSEHLFQKILRGNDAKLKKNPIHKIMLNPVSDLLTFYILEK